MAPASNRAALRALVRAFPPLKLALAIYDFTCGLLKSLIDGLCYLLRQFFIIIYSVIKKVLDKLVELLNHIPICRRAGQATYKRIKRKEHKEPIPYRSEFIKRSLTYHGGMFLALILYVFVYIVLVKHHTYASVAVAFVIMLIYLIVIENSHNIRSILMLCLPIMFTNRGRALIFCSMLAILASGPIKNIQLNISELHSSLNCCKQYLVIKTDKYIDKNVVHNLMRAEDMLTSLVDSMKQFTKELKDRLDVAIRMAESIEEHLIGAIKELKRIVNVCNSRTADLYQGCLGNFGLAYRQCKINFFFPFSAFCDLIMPMKHICQSIELPSALCSFPSVVAKFIDSTIGERLRTYVKVLENEFFVDVDIDYKYQYNATKSKSFKQLGSEVSFDVERKFWYVQLVGRVFNLISLILVVWILSTATLYQMHYLTELSYDNMYIDDNLKEIDERRKRDSEWREGVEEEEEVNEESKGVTDVTGFQEQADVASITSNSSNESRENLLLDINNNSLGGLSSVSSPVRSTTESAEEKKIMQQLEEKSQENESEKSIAIKEGEYLFPLSRTHMKYYSRPFSVRMNKIEKQKLCVSGFIWSAIIGYIIFFILFDYILYCLIDLIDNILRDILFTSDLPLVDIESKSGDNIVRYNRTYIKNLRMKQSQSKTSEVSPVYGTNGKNSTVQAFYRRLMTRIEAGIPDDIQILDSLEQCLPSARNPDYRDYKLMLILALITFLVVILEAYALRTRHWIANLYYPRRARRRAVWLYRKLLAEKPKMEDTDTVDEQIYENLFKRS